MGRLCGRTLCFCQIKSRFGACLKFHSTLAPPICAKPDPELKNFLFFRETTRLRKKLFYAIGWSHSLKMPKFNASLNKGTMFSFFLIYSKFYLITIIISYSIIFLIFFNDLQHDYANFCINFKIF